MQPVPAIAGKGADRRQRQSSPPYFIHEANAFKINQTYSLRRTGATIQIYESGVVCLFQEPETETYSSLLATEMGQVTQL